MPLADGRDEILSRKLEINAPPDRALYTTLERLVRDSGTRVVVSFGGGSVPGLCGNVALARVLEELDLKDSVDEVWGTSAGAAVGGPWSSGTDALDILSNIAALNHRGSVDIMWWTLLKALLLAPFGRPLPDGLVRGKHFRRTVESSLSVANFEDCPIPFRCIACTDDGTAKRKIFRRGPLLPAILSSMSIPGVMVPQPIPPGEECGTYDGALVEKTPLFSPIADHQRLHSSKPLLVIGTHYGNEAHAMRARGFLSRFLSSINALEEVCWGYQLNEARERKNAQLLLLNPRMNDKSLFDFSRVEANYLHARASFLTDLQNGRIGLTFGGK
jgi:predicted acylesterase/phospholipase RssA